MCCHITDAVYTATRLTLCDILRIQFNAFCMLVKMYYLRLYAGNLSKNTMHMKAGWKCDSIPDR